MSIFLGQFASNIAGCTKGILSLWKTLVNVVLFLIAWTQISSVQTDVFAITDRIHIILCSSFQILGDLSVEIATKIHREADTVYSIITFNLILIFLLMVISAVRAIYKRRLQLPEPLLLYNAGILLLADGIHSYFGTINVVGIILVLDVIVLIAIKTAKNRKIKNICMRT